MSNCYDIEIKMNYFMSGTSYEESLEDLKKFQDEIESHLGYWEDTCDSEEAFNEEWNKIYGEDKEDYPTIDKIEDNTAVIKIQDSNKFIIQSF